MTEPHPPEPTPWYPPPGRAPQRPAQRSLARRISRAAAIVLAIVLGVGLLAIVAALVYLYTGSGARTLGEVVTREAATAIQGQLRVASIDVSGFLEICADGVDLRDPDGHPVLRAERVCIHVNPIALRAHKVLLRDVRLVRPWIETANVEGPDGKPTTTLARALAPRKPPSPQQQSGPFAWVIDVSGVRIEQGSFAMRPALDAKPAFAVEALELVDGYGHYAADQSAARLQLGGGLEAPGRAPVAVRLDARLDGDTASGKLALNELGAQMGKSGLRASGSYDLGARIGELHVRELRVEPQDLDLLSRASAGPLAGAVRGEVDVRIAGKLVDAAARLEMGGGRASVDGQVALDGGPRWNVALQLDRVDPAAVARAGPRGTVTARLEAKGTGIPRFDEHGVLGQLQAKAHVGPARLDRMGEVKADLEADLRGRNALVRAFTATALGITASIHGQASRDALALDVDLRSPDLSAAGKAVGAFRKGPTLPLAGSAHLVAHVTGSPRRPDAQVHLRAPMVRSPGKVFASRLAVDGRLQGDLRAPNGQLVLSADELTLGELAPMHEPRISAQLAWPMAHLRIASAVDQGQLQLAGDARIDDDKDGLLLSHFLVSYPGNELRLAHDVRVHFRPDETVVEPLDLIGDHGSLRLSAQVRAKRIDAAVVVTRLDLERLPKFALPKDLGLRGQLDANLVVSGLKSRPEIDLQADVRAGAIARTADLPVDARTHAHLHGGRLRADGFVRAQGGPELTFDADAPVLAGPAGVPTASVKADVRIANLDLARVADRLHLEAAQRAGLQGTVEARLLAMGTLAAPAATLSIEARNVGTSRLHDVDVRAGLVLDKGRAVLDGVVALAGEPTLSLAGNAPFELLRAVRDRGYLAGALDRPLQADLAVASLPLDRLARAGALPQGSSGELGFSLHVAGTASAPKVSLTARGDSIVSGHLNGLSFQSQLSLDQKFQLTASAQTNGEPIARGDANVAISGAEASALLRRRKDPAALDPLLDRPVSLALDVPGLVIGRVAQLAGQGSVPAEGRLEAHLTIAGSAANPRVEGRVDVRDLKTSRSRIGNADLSLDASQSGASLHLGINPPGGGTFTGQAKLSADLGARSLLRNGTASVLRGDLSGQVAAQHLDIAFLSGVLPLLRRTGGTLDGDVKVTGLLGRPLPEGQAHLRHGLFDLVGQGVYDEVGLDATFSPKEVVIDRLAGSTAGGTFAAILVGSRKVATDIASDRLEFTGEVHLGDDESVKGRTAPNGAPLHKGPIPIRQAGEERLRVGGEIDFFGDSTGGLLTLNAKVPSADVKVLKLPDRKLPALDPNPDVLLVHAGERPHPPGKEPGAVEAEAKARRESKFRLHAQLDVDHVYVSAEDFEFPLESHLTFDYDAKHPDQPSASGTIHVPNGSFSALGRRFVIEDAKIIETGGDITDPELEIKARFDNPKAVVTVTVAGTAKNPQLDLSSNPPMDQDAIAFFLATGRIQAQATQNGGSVDLQGAASSVLGGLLFGQLRNTLKSFLPVDVLTVETEGAQLSQAGVGKYIGDRIYIGYRQRLTPATALAENNVEGTLEYEISRSLAAEAVIGDKTKAMSILWTHDF